MYALAYNITVSTAMIKCYKGKTEHNCISLCVAYNTMLFGCIMDSSTTCQLADTKATCTLVKSICQTHSRISLMIRRLRLIVFLNQN